jgi:hypothetical protein
MAQTEGEAGAALATDVTTRMVETIPVETPLHIRLVCAAAVMKATLDAMQAKLAQKNLGFGNVRVWDDKTEAAYRMVLGGSARYDKNQEESSARCDTNSSASSARIVDRGTSGREGGELISVRKTDDSELPLGHAVVSLQEFRRKKDAAVPPESQ